MALGLATAAALGALLLAQAPAAARLLRRLRRVPAAPAGPRPRAAAVLCVRGADPTLGDCVVGLLAQDYAPYEVVIVVDREDDPGAGVVRDVIARRGGPPVRVEALARRLGSCSLKCSALVQAVAGLDDAVEVVALVDADTVPHPGWLRELTAPLADPGVGAAAGVRWYEPGHASPGSLVRYLWNAAAIVCMHAFGIVWGGSLAFRRDALERAGLPAKWARAYCEDTMTYAALKAAGLRTAYVPTLIMVHRDACTLAGFAEWCVRQMLTSRLYHPAWPVIVAHGVASTLAWAAPAALAAGAAALGRREQALWAAVALGAYWVIQVAGLAALELSVRRCLALQGRPLPRPSSATWLGAALAVPLAQAVYAFVLVRTLFTRRVRWRGVWYEIAGPWDIRRDEG